MACSPRAMMIDPTSVDSDKRTNVVERTDAVTLQPSRQSRQLLVVLLLVKVKSARTLRLLR